MFLTRGHHAGATQESILQRAILSMEKLIKEGTPKEAQIILGWLLDMWRLPVALPLQDKFDA